MDLEFFANDVEAENDGRWVIVGKETRVKIASKLSPNYEDTARKYLKAFKKEGQKRVLDRDDEIKLQAEIFADAIIKDWEGFTMDDEEYPYTRDNVITLMTDPKYKRFRALMQDLANEDAMFIKEQKDETLGN